MARYPSAMLAACPTAWDDDERLDEAMFRREVQLVLEGGFDHLYVFGTGSEGYAVDTARFTQVARAFWDETQAAHPMIGVIGLSTANIVERLRIAYEIGFRTFQISLPSWGPLTDDEVLRFFVDVCGTFPDAPFLHYNLPRTKRVLTGVHYARLIGEVPNLVATKNTAGGLDGRRRPAAPRARAHAFHGRGQLPARRDVRLGRVAGDDGASWRRCAAASSSRPADARPRDALHAPARVRALDRESVGVALTAPHMDGAYDKMLTKLGMLPDFPLRLLSPYTSFKDDDYRAMKEVLDDGWRDWIR